MNADSNLPNEEWTKVKSSDYDATSKTYSATVTGLSEGTTYCYKPYVVYNGKTSYYGGYWFITTQRMPSQGDNQSPGKKD